LMVTTKNQQTLKTHTAKAHTKQRIVVVVNGPDTTGQSDAMGKDMIKILSLSLEFCNALGIVQELRVFWFKLNPPVVPGVD